MVLPSSRPMNGYIVCVPTLSRFSSYCWCCYHRGFSLSARICPDVFPPFWAKTCLSKREGRRAAHVRTTRVIGEALCSHPRQAVALLRSAGAVRGKQLHPGTANREHADQSPKPKPGTQRVVFSPEIIIKLLFLLLYFLLPQCILSRHKNTKDRKGGDVRETTASNERHIHSPTEAPNHERGGSTSLLAL